MAVLTWKSHNNTMGQQAIIEEKLRQHLIAIKPNFTGRQWNDICEARGVYYMVTKAMLDGFVVMDEDLLKTVRTPAQANALYENMKTMQNLYEKEVKKNPKLDV